MCWATAGTEGEAGPTEEVEIESPDPPVTTSRMLHFLYTGELLPASADQLLQVWYHCILVFSAVVRSSADAQASVHTLYVDMRGAR